MLSKNIDIRVHRPGIKIQKLDESRSKIEKSHDITYVRARFQGRANVANGWHIREKDIYIYKVSISPQKSQRFAIVVIFGVYNTYTCAMTFKKKNKIIGVNTEECIVCAHLFSFTIFHSLSLSVYEATKKKKIVYIALDHKSEGRVSAKSVPLNYQITTERHHKLQHISILFTLFVYIIYTL